MGYSNYLNPRAETISEEGIEGIIDLANLSSGSLGRIEAKPGAFFSFSSEKEGSGLFLFEGLKGNGKSKQNRVQNTN